MIRLTKITWLFFVLLMISSAVAQIQTPSQYLGVEIGADSQLVDYDQIIDYLRYLEKTTDKIVLKDLGETTMGNRFMMAIVSSPQNLANLDRIREINAKLADPRKLQPGEEKSLIQEGKTVVLLNCAIHSTEIGSTQLVPLLVHYLVTSTNAEVQNILDNVVLLITPSHNPDGHNLVTHWYREHGNAPMPFLYHKYVGHDNNRDWFMFTQKETRITVQKIHNVWHPQIVHDMHQMGSSGPRIFCPPYTDPFEPNVHPILIAQVNMLGETMAAALIRSGKTGVITNSIFDLWTPARAYQHYHGGIRVLTEVASAALATPIEIPASRLRGRGGVSLTQPGMHFPKPWPGGTWRLRDIIDYERIAVLAELEHAAKFREEWLQGFYKIHQDFCSYEGKPWGYRIPYRTDKLTETADLLDVLQTGAVEVYRITRDETVAGVSCRQGDYVVPLAQPYGGFARALLEKRDYPALVDASGKLKRPYDIVVHNLPYMLSLTIDTLDVAPGSISPKPVSFESQKPELPQRAKFFAVEPQSYGADILALRIAQMGTPIRRLKQPYYDGKKMWKQGTFIVPNNRNVRAELPEVLAKTPVWIKPVLKKWSGAKMVRVKNPRIGLYHSFVPSMDEGWTRWIFDDYGIRYESLKNKDIQNLKRKKLDIVLFASQAPESIIRGYSSKNLPEQYRGGIGEQGIDALKSFVEKGGTVLAWGNSTELFIRQFGLKLQNTLQRLSPTQYYVPGSLLAVKADISNPLCWGYDEEVTILFRRGQAFKVQEGEVVASFREGNPLQTGWLTGPEYLSGKPVAVVVPYGKGKIILLGFNPQFRAQTRGSYKFLFNAIFLAASD